MTDPINIRPMSPQTALADIEWYEKNPPNLEQHEAQEIFRAALSLAVATRRVLSLNASRIDAVQLVVINNYDSVSFYQGVAFALAKVNATLGGWEGGSD